MRRTLISSLHVIALVLVAASRGAEPTHTFEPGLWGASEWDRATWR